MKIGSPVQWTPDGVTLFAGVIVSDLVYPVVTYSRNSVPVVTTPGQADLLVWDAVGAPSLKNNVVRDINQATPNSFRELI